MPAWGMMDGLTLNGLDARTLTVGALSRALESIRGCASAAVPLTAGRSPALLPPRLPSDPFWSGAAFYTFDPFEGSVAPFSTFRRSLPPICGMGGFGGGSLGGC